MSHPAVVALVLKLLVGCYSYMLLMASANVLSCELRRPGQCGNQWTQAFTVAAVPPPPSGPTSPTPPRKRAPPLTEGGPAIPSEDLPHEILPHPHRQSTAESRPR